MRPVQRLVKLHGWQLKYRHVTQKRGQKQLEGLMVHTAEWPGALKQQFLKLIGRSKFTKSVYGRLLRFCGYGVPNLARSLACASNSLILIAESVIQPYEKKEG